jgi:hypothetical protein
MKIKLTPGLSYICGMIKYRRAKKGVGVFGSPPLVQAFCSAVVEQGLVESTMIQTDEKRAYFFHSAYRTFIEKTLKREEEAFVHLNDYSASFLAGLFDSVGGFGENDIPYLAKHDAKDEFIIEKLGFITKSKGSRLLIGPAEQFLKYISHYRKISDFDIRNSWKKRD